MTRLELIRQREERATKGRWEAILDPCYYCRQDGLEEFLFDPGPKRGDHGAVRGRADAEFIAHSREDIPALLAVVEAAQQLIVVWRHNDTYSRRYPLKARDLRLDFEKVATALAPLLESVDADRAE